MTVARDQLYLYPTWLSKLMAGEVSCEWATWFRVHFKDWSRPPSDFDSATYNMLHTRLAREMREQRDRTQEKLYVERQGQFWYTHPNGIRISGTPDLVTLGQDGNCIHDAKTSTPKASDRVQVLIYMYCLPRSDNPLFKGKTFSGHIKYWDHEAHIAADAVNGAFEDQFLFWMDVLGADTPPERFPSEQECAFCNIGRADCDERATDQVLDEQ